jgi:hypothetical protein
MLSAAHAQSQAPMSSGGAYSANSSSMSSQQPGSQSMGKNCGTPDEPKPCPPLPITAGNDGWFHFRSDSGIRQAFQPAGPSQMKYRIEGVGDFTYDCALAN